MIAVALLASIYFSRRMTAPIRKLEESMEKVSRGELGAEAEVEITGLRTPCLKMDGYRAGLQKLMWGPRDAKGKRERRAGVMAVVVAGGEVLVGDRMVIELPPEPYLMLGPV